MINLQNNVFNSNSPFLLIKRLGILPQTETPRITTGNNTGITRLAFINGFQAILGKISKIVFQ